MAFLDTLPDPNFKMNLAGIDDASGITSPGFMEVKLTSAQNIMRTNVNSKRYENDDTAYHTWKVRIDYNELTCEEFHPVYSFLMLKKATMEPFYVSLPQYRNQNLEQKETQDWSDPSPINYQVGYDRIEVLNMSTNPTVTTAGAMFRTDVSDKLYMVTRVETSSENVYALTSINDERIWFTPGLATEIPPGTVLSFDNIRMRAIQTMDVLEYDLGADGLFNFSVEFEEVY
jgi:hypothetical protein